MAEYVLDIDGVKYRLSTATAMNGGYHLKLSVAGEAEIVTPIKDLSRLEQDALYARVRELRSNLPGDPH